MRNNPFRTLSLCCGLSCFLSLSAAQAAVTIDHDTIRLQALNKATTRTSTFEVKIGDTVKVGPLYIRPQACRTAPITEEPESAGFLQIWTLKDTAKDTTPTEEPATKTSEWVFSGWMFASSPGLSSMDHPVYDLWVVDCGANADQITIDSTPDSEETPIDETASETDTPQASYIIEDTLDDDGPIVIIDGQEIRPPATNEIDPTMLPDPELPHDQLDQNLNQDDQSDPVAEEDAPIVHLD